MVSSIAQDGTRIARGILYDSLPSVIHTGPALVKAAACIAKFIPNRTPVIEWSPGRCGRQDNVYDCGVCTIANAVSTLHGETMEMVMDTQWAVKKSFEYASRILDSAKRRKALEVMKIESSEIL
jgi:hypothetical protein